MPKTTATKKTAAAKSTKSQKKATTKKAPVQTSSVRKPQMKILLALKKKPTGFDRKTLSTKASVEYASLTEYIGSLNEEIRLSNDEKHFPSLISLGYVKAQKTEGRDGKDLVTYVITAKGKKIAA